MENPSSSELEQSWALEGQVKNSLSQLSSAGLGKAILLHQAASALALSVFFLVLAFDRGPWTMLAVILFAAGITIPAARHELNQRKLLPSGALKMEKRSKLWTGVVGAGFLALAIYVLMIEHEASEPIGLWAVPLAMLAVVGLLPRTHFGMTLVRQR